MSSPSSAPTLSVAKATRAAKASSTAAAAAATARRAKKREQDRRCQRMLRERTKNRIAYLENLLEQQGTSAQLQTMLRERDEAVADRDRLIQALRTINRVVKMSHPLLATTASLRQSSERETPAVQESTPTDDNTSPAADTAPIVTGGLATEPPLSMSQMAGDFADTVWLAEAFDEISGSDIENLFMTGPMRAAPLSSYNLPQQHFPNAEADLFSSEPCECSPRRPARSTSGHPLSLWRFASETLAERIPWSREISDIEDALAEDIPVRAIAESWDAAAQSLGGVLPPSWQLLRRIDETMFAAFGVGSTERLASMRTMHTLLLAQADATPERTSRLPDWLIARPSQTIAHSAATDYFTWPGLRERFVFHQHRYCTNRFWTAFTKSLHVQWPYEFRDCYTRSTSTGRYSISPTFQERIGDIRAFTMGEDLFRLWPELRADIPSAVSMPMSLTPSWGSAIALANGSRSGGAGGGYGGGEEQRRSNNLALTGCAGHHGKGMQARTGPDRLVDAGPTPDSEEDRVVGTPGAQQGYREQLHFPSEGAFASSGQVWALSGWMGTTRH